MDTKQEQGQLRLLVLARSYLVRARISRQEATVMKETYNAISSDAEIRRIVTMCRQDARKWRKQARDVLIAFEEINGRSYATNIPYRPLKYNLEGFKFREWKEYEDEYLKVEMFQGTDPE